MNGQMKTKSILLSRRARTPPRKEESVNIMITGDNQDHTSNLDSVLNSPIARTSRLCSTPIQKNVELMEDSPDHDYNASPMSMFPCTQDSNEIAWDWQSGVNKNNDTHNGEKRNKNNAVLNITPKRTQQFLQKKRILKSGSPLLNLNSKRKLVNLDVAESIGKFAAELKALSDKIKAVQSKDVIEIDKGGGLVGESPAPGSSNQLGIHDMETQNAFDIHDADTLEVGLIPERKNEEEKPNSSVDDLFDDSIDACMVQCSQEVENNLRLSSDKSRIADSSNDECGEKKMHSTSSTGYSNDNISDKNIQNKSDNEKSAQECALKSSDKTNFKKVVQNCAKLTTETNLPPSQIPDDSFDECFFNGLEDDDELLQKFYEGEKIKGSNTDLDVSSNFKRKQQCLGYDTSATTSQNRKFFKAKSLSDSSYVKKDDKLIASRDAVFGNIRSGSAPIAKSASNCNLRDENRDNGIQSKVYSSPNLNSSISTAGGRNSLTIKQSSCTTVSYSYRRTSNDNLTVENKFNGRRFDLYSCKSGMEKSLKELRTTMATNSQQQRCTEEEIERKRLEAKMRLEKNRLKKSINPTNKGNSGVFSNTNKRPVNNNSNSKNNNNYSKR